MLHLDFRTPGGNAVPERVSRTPEWTPLMNAAGQAERGTHPANGVILPPVKPDAHHRAHKGRTGVPRDTRRHGGKEDYLDFHTPARGGETERQKSVDDGARSPRRRGAPRDQIAQGLFEIADGRRPQWADARVTKTPETAPSGGNWKPENRDRAARVTCQEPPRKRSL